MHKIMKVGVFPMNIKSSAHAPEKLNGNTQLRKRSISRGKNPTGAQMSATIRPIHNRQYLEAESYLLVTTAN